MQFYLSGAWYRSGELLIPANQVNIFTYMVNTCHLIHGGLYVIVIGQWGSTSKAIINSNIQVFILENEFERVICKILVTLSPPKYVKKVVLISHNTFYRKISESRKSSRSVWIYLANTFHEQTLQRYELSTFSPFSQQFKKYILC